MYQFAIDEKYNHETFMRFLQDFLPDSFEPKDDPIFYDFAKVDGNGKSFVLGECEQLDLVVYEFYHTYTTDPRVGLTKEVAGYMKNTSACSNALVVFHNPNIKQWRLSLLTTDVEKTESGKLIRTYSNPKRFSFMLGEGCKKHTPQLMLFSKGKVKNFEDLKNRFAIDVVTEKFYKELFGWYEWAVSLSKFPDGKGSNVELNNKNNELNIIRLITRLMFVWFIKQKGLIPDWIFDEQEVNNVLVNFNPQSDKTGCYYNAIIQNLFFATLNRAINERAFAETVAYKRNEHYGINSFFRNDKDKSFFKVSNDRILELFKPVPFLNGGLFECLDKLDTRADGHNEQTYIDGFSREQTRRAFVPNILFWGKEKDEHEGIISLLNRYNFTVEENTPTEVEVALDPELLGKVFENLLGTYNPETRETARKDSGSFYTPREIVNFMVDEALKHYLLKNLEKITEDEVSILFSDSEEIPPYDTSKKTSIASALERIKILDPACGSGAFPMGCLQRIIQIENKLINDNDSYKRKLHLIKNCIYGIDIQPIAVQISKLRFFISLICEQKTNSNANDNYGIEPLPNLETKFVAANSLVGRKIDKNYNTSSLFENPEIEKTKIELQEVRSKHFDAKTSKDKKEYRRQDQLLRERLVDLLVKEKHSNPDDAKLLVSWNPYDQNTASPFFDMEWMFGEKEGFDIVIGNPPYISTKGVSANEKTAYEREFGFSDDTYNLFTFKGLSLAKEKGSLTYIIPKTFWTTQTKRNLRDLILDKNIRYIFDTANPFDAVMVDTCIIQIENSKYEKQNKIRFLDGSTNLLKPLIFEPILQDVYLNTQNCVIFKPTEQNMKIWKLYGRKVKDLYNTWWDKIETSKKISQNEVELKHYRESLKPGDIALLGALTEGGVGLQTGNNGKYIAVRRSTKWAINIITSRPKKLAIAMKENKKLAAELGDIEPISFLASKNENQIAELFDSLKEKFGRDIFGQGYIYKIIDDNEMADVELLSADEKENGIDPKKKFYVPYDKGDKDGNRWYLETPFAIAWTKENVHFLKTDPRARYQGYTFFFKEGFCWNNVLTTYIKCRKKQKTVQSTESMSFFACTEKTPEDYLICVMNSRLAAFYVDCFVNSTSHCTTGDAKLLPIIIPTQSQLMVFKTLFDQAYSIKNRQFAGEFSEKQAETVLEAIQEKLDKLVNDLYGV